MRTLRSRLDGEVLDVLFVNAGICLARENTPADVAFPDIVDFMATNTLSPVRVVEILCFARPSKMGCTNDRELLVEVRKLGHTGGPAILVRRHHRVPRDLRGVWWR